MNNQWAATFSKLSEDALKAINNSIYLSKFLICLIVCLAADQRGI